MTTPKPSADDMDLAADWLESNDGDTGIHAVAAWLRDQAAKRRESESIERIARLNFCSQRFVRAAIKAHRKAQESKP